MARATARTSPPRTPSAREATDITRARMGSSRPSAHHAAQAQELPGDDQALDLARALADRAELAVAQVALDRVVLHEAVATVDLDRVEGDLHCHLAGIELGHRRLRGVLLAGVAQHGRAPH